jgi:tetratricopeptide (TPR) repeat protein
MAARGLEASIYQAEGNLEKAVESYTAALDLAVGDKDKQDILINIAMCYEQKEQYQKALESLNKIKMSAPFLDEKKKQLERLARFKNTRLNR